MMVMMLLKRFILLLNSRRQIHICTFQDLWQIRVSGDQMLLGSNCPQRSNAGHFGEGGGFDIHCRFDIYDRFDICNRFDRFCQIRLCFLHANVIIIFKSCVQRGKCVPCVEAVIEINFSFRPCLGGVDTRYIYVHRFLSIHHIGSERIPTN